MEEIKQAVNKWAVEALLALIAMIAVLLRRLLTGHSNSVKVTYEQLSLLIAEKAGQAEKAEEQNMLLQKQIDALQEELLFLKSSLYTSKAGGVKQRVFERVSKNRVREAIEELKIWAVAEEDGDLMQEVALQSGQLQSVTEQLRRGLIGGEEGRRAKNRVKDAVLAIAQEIQDPP